MGFIAADIIVKADPSGLGGILGLIIVVLAIGWLVHGHIGGLSF